jgi:hypothetical protein
VDLRADLLALAQQPGLPPAHAAPLRSMAEHLRHAQLPA